VGIRAVAFDVMDTVVHDPFREAIEAATGLPASRFFAQRDPDLYRSLERAEIDERAYWQRIRDAGIDVDPDAFHRVRIAGTRWIEGMPDLLDDLQGVVVRATASNYPVWIDALAARLIGGRFEHVVASCHLGVRKPDRGFFVGLLDRVGCAVDEVLFVDDREGNVEAARSFGLRSHRFTGTAALRAWLVDEGVFSR
jgi:FMN hydrolase / 5-amino-6-(5-phospho-D-ribitylamino)uracil phosphatase